MKHKFLGRIRYLPHFKYLCGAYVGVSLLVAISAISGIEMKKLSMDALQQLKQPFYLGQLSNLGILSWCAAAVVCLFASIIISIQNKSVEDRKFLRWFGTLSIILLLDDMLMLHESVFPNYFNISEIYIELFYFVYVVIFLYKFWYIIVEKTYYGYLFLAFFFLGTSVAIDINIFPGGIDVEDSFKIFGILTYTYYAILSSISLLEINN